MKSYNLLTFLFAFFIKYVFAFMGNIHKSNFSYKVLWVLWIYSETDAVGPS